MPGGAGAAPGPAGTSRQLSGRPNAGNIVSWRTLELLVLLLMFSGEVTVIFSPVVLK